MNLASFVVVYCCCWWWWCLNWPCCVFDFEDINECDTGNNTCTTEQVCFNFQGGYTCLNPLQCPLPYIEVSDKWVLHPPFTPPSSQSYPLQLNAPLSLWLPSLQSVHVFGREPCLQGQTLHYSVPTHGSVVGPQRACRYLPDAGHHALPRRLLHLPDKVGKRWKRVLHEGEWMQSKLLVPVMH